MFIREHYKAENCLCEALHDRAAACGIDDGETLGGVGLAYAVRTDRRLAKGQGRRNIWTDKGS